MTAGGGLAKMAASSAFVLTALLAGALDTGWGSWLLGGLIASWFGDLALIGRTRAAFLAGLGAFLLAHISYVAGFIARGISVPTAFIGAGTMAVIGAATLVWLRPHAAGLFPAVAIYVGTSALMVATATGTHAYASAWILVIGSVGFAASDLAVAKDRFVTPGIANRRWGRPLYFASQFLIALASGS
ncbi:MAG: lysoplasmalogenase [Acidimicrobiia bacterium]|nr:lysoplasmalogenase [Acidimicrobiia bacterium]